MMPVVYLDELPTAALASEVAVQPEGDKAAPEAPWTLERLRAEEPLLCEEIAASARAEYQREHPLPAPGTMQLIAGAREKERARVLGIIGHPEAVGREDLARKLAAMPGLTVADASSLLAGTSKALGPAEEFHELMARLAPTPATEQAEEERYLARMQGYEAQASAELARVRAARAASADEGEQR
jgi:hypothetical protein